MEEKFLYMSTNGLIALIKKGNVLGVPIITPVELHSLELPLGGDALLTKEDVDEANYINQNYFIAVSEHGDEEGKLASVDKMNKALLGWGEVMKIEDAKSVEEYTDELLSSVEEYTDELLSSIKEISSRSPFKRSIFNKAKFHKLEDSSKKLYFISDTRMMHKEDFISRNKLDFYYDIHDDHMKMMDDACRLVISRCLEYCSIQGDNTKNELEFDGLIRHLSPTPVKNLKTLIGEHLGTTDKPMITFTYGEDNVMEQGGAIIAEDDNFDGIDIYFSAHRYILSEDLFSIVWQGYIEFSPELLKRMTLYTYPIGEDNIII